MDAPQFVPDPQRNPRIVESGTGHSMVTGIKAAFPPGEDADWSADMKLEGKRVLVTGSTNGIGRGAAQLLHEAGAHVAINGRNAATVADTITAIGGERLVAAVGDLRTVEGCRNVVQTAIAALGGLDCLVNNVGVCPLAYLMDVTEEHWDEVVDINLRSAFFCTQSALPALRKSRGNVVMVSSVAGLCAGPTDSFVYAITKGGLVNMTRALALELARDVVRVNCVCPGYTDTPMVQAENQMTGGQIYGFVEGSVPLGRLCSVRECASAILYLASDEAAYATGTILVNDGGCTANASWGGANHRGAAAASAPAYIAPSPAA
jgi:NAD(P)-dependent dehydrogenase (short-subunit alcohol dehydrogenase family)